MREQSLVKCNSCAPPGVRIPRRGSLVNGQTGGGAGGDATKPGRQFVFVIEKAIGEFVFNKKRGRRVGGSKRVGRSAGRAMESRLRLRADVLESKDRGFRKGLGCLWKWMSEGVRVHMSNWGAPKIRLEERPGRKGGLSRGSGSPPHRRRGVQGR